MGRANILWSLESYFANAINIMTKAAIFGISRHRILRDGDGVTTLVGMKGCPLRCAYCINKGPLESDSPHSIMSASQLLEKVAVDDVYFRASNGGVTFGGGESLLHPVFIKEFRSLCPSAWKINIETSLNIKSEALAVVLESADSLIVDIKSMVPDIYRRYTGISNHQMIYNLSYLSECQLQDKVVIRVPVIPCYNDASDVKVSIKTLKAMGFRHFKVFRYVQDLNKVPQQPQATEYGKGICNILKHIRTVVAEANDISLNEDNCPMTKCKSGTCPKCESALSFLSNNLKNRLNPIY